MGACGNGVGKISILQESLGELCLRVMGMRGILFFMRELAAYVGRVVVCWEREQAA